MQTTARMRFLIPLFFFLTLATAIPHGMDMNNMNTNMNLIHRPGHNHNKNNQPMIMAHKNHHYQTKSLPSMHTNMYAQTNATSNTTTTGAAIIQNSCAYPLYLWTVGSTISPQKTLPAYHVHRESYRHDAHSGGVALKMTTQPNGLFTGKPQTIFAYNLNANVSRVWYDLSDVFGDPFEGSQVQVEPAEPEIRWLDGVPPKGSQVRVVDARQDLRVTFC